MDVVIAHARWSGKANDRHRLAAVGLLVLSGYLLFVLFRAMLAPARLTTPGSDRVSVSIEMRQRPAREAAASESEPVVEERVARPDTPETPATPSPQGQARAAPPVDASPARSGADGPRLDLSLPSPAPTQPARCRAGPCAPGTTDGRPAVRRERRPVDEVLADLDPEVLESLDLEALGIEREAVDAFGEQVVPLGRGCSLVQRADNIATRQMTARQFIRCRGATPSKARAQALLDALREKRPDLFEGR